MISGRRSYFDLVMKMTGDTEGFVTYPNYEDFQGKLVYEFSPNQKLSLSSFHGRDWMVFNIDEPDFQGNFKWESRKNLESLSLRSIWGKEWLLQSTLSYSQNSRSIHLGTRWTVDEAETDFGWKEDLTFSPSSQHEWRGGFWFTPLTHRNIYNMPADKDTSWGSATVSEKKVEMRPSSYKGAFYLEDKFHPFGPGGLVENLVILSGLRFDYLRMNLELLISPRFSLAYSFAPKTTLTGAWGYFYQFPELFKLDPKEGNPSLKSRQAIHYILGLEHEFGEGLITKAEAYYKKLSRLITRDSLNQYHNDGFGMARGVEFLFQKRKGKLFGWLSYGLSVSKRKEGDAENEIYHDYDMRHILTLVINYKFGESLQLGGKWRYSSGRPFTPVEGAWYDPVANKWHPILGERNGERYPPYHRLDLRLLYKHTLRGNSFTSFIELFNLYNRKNVLEYEYNWDYSERKEISFFSFMPVGGLMVEF